MDKFIPIKPEKEVISFRIDKELLNNLDDFSAKLNISRNELISQCLKFAIDKIDINKIT